MPVVLLRRRRPVLRGHRRIARRARRHRPVAAAPRPPDAARAALRRERSRGMTDRPPEELLSAYLDGELDADERARVEAPARGVGRVARRCSTSCARPATLAARAARCARRRRGFCDGVARRRTHRAVRSRLDAERPPAPRHADRRLASPGAAAAAAIVAVVLVPARRGSKPAVATFVSSHAARVVGERGAGVASSRPSPRR